MLSPSEADSVTSYTLSVSASTGSSKSGEMANCNSTCGPKNDRENQ